MSDSQAPNSAHIGTRAVFKRFWPYMRRRWALISGSGAAMFLEIGLRLLEPWPLKFIFDAALHETGTNSTGVGFLDKLAPGTMLTLCAVALVVIVAARAGASYLRRVGFALAGNIVLTEVRADLFAHIQRLSLTFHSKRRTGDLATRLTSDIGRLQEIVSTAVLPLIAHILTVLGVAIIMLIIEWRLALVAFAVLPLFWLSTQRIGKKIRNTARKERERHGEMGAIATEALGSISVVQSLGGEDTHNKRFGARNLSSLKEGVKGKRLAAQLLGTADIFIALGTAIMLWYGARLVMQGELQVTTLLVFFFYHKNMTRPIRNVAKYSGRTAKALASAERIVELLDTAPTLKESPNAVEAPRTIERLAFEHLRFGYEPGTLALDDFTLEAKVGTVTALVGPSGAGKSTLMNLLLRLYDPDSGRITIDSRDIHDFTINSWRRRIAVVPQETTLFAGTIRENISFGQSDISEERVVEAAKLACADEFIMRMPEGYDTLIGERGNTLSEGQRQRLAIARAAVREAPILILDEPTASLDNENTELICRAIRNLARNRICFVISHDLRTIIDADQIVCLNRGRIAEHGSHDSLLARDGEYAKLYRLQTGDRQECEVVDA
ncbi:Efflux ABC transporter, permease/ATP-binding protein [hydrothermal vent metagenome]|uniref:Efflux ABC transporter, permease/ATP-binding protein n=1 Tax=hydrothermal vent metagenome TaxID=652676 RepID=A0A3B1E5Z4_9ZZZZ